jgi:hypothetical protein
MFQLTMLTYGYMYSQKKLDENDLLGLTGLHVT